MEGSWKAMHVMHHDLYLIFYEFSFISIIFVIWKTVKPTLSKLILHTLNTCRVFEKWKM